MTGVSVSVSVEGGAEVDRMLGLLPITLRDKTLQRAMRKAAEAGRKKAKARAPKGNGVGGDSRFPDLGKSVKSKTWAKGTVVVGIVGTAPEAVQAHLVEKGHRMVVGGTVPSGKNNRIRKATDPDKTGKGTVIGDVAPHPWFRPSYDEAAPEIEQILLDELEMLVDDIAFGA